MGDLTGALSHGIIKYQVPYFPEGYRLETTNVKKEMQSDREMLGASVKNSACGKGHEEGGSAYAKAGSTQESPWKFSSIYPQNQNLPTFCFVLSPLTLLGAVPYDHLALSVKELTYSSN